VTYLDLHDRRGVSGDIGPLGRLAELRYLDLSGTAVAGDVAALAALGQLRYLYLYGTAVWGRADALRAIPGLGADWYLFTACAAGGNAIGTVDDFGQCPAGRSPVADGASYLGADECACCSGSQKLLLGSGVCLDPSLCVYDSAGVCVGALPPLCPCVPVHHTSSSALTPRSCSRAGVRRRHVRGVSTLLRWQLRFAVQRRGQRPDRHGPDDGRR
jgi:hypothetical protein